MKIEFDKRLELIYGLLYCVDKDYQTGPNGLYKTELDSYCKEFYDMYKKGVDKELIDYIRNYGFGTYGQTAEIALCLDNDYNLKIDNNIKEMNNPNFDKDKIEILLKRFVENSNYEQFYEKHQNLYNNIINSFKKSMSEYDIFESDFISEFYGYKLGKKCIKLYNFTSGSMGILKDDYQYYIQRVENINKDENNIVFKPKLTNLIHEFSHPYINPLMDKYFSEVDMTSLLNESQEHGLDNCYRTQDAVLKEYGVRAVQIYLGKNYMSEQYINEQIESQKNSGYNHIEKLVELFNKKDYYSDFESFFRNEIFSYFINLNRELSQNKIIK